MANQAHVIDEIQKNANETIRVCLSTYKDRRYLDLRLFFKGDGGAWIPSKKGLTIPAGMLEKLETSISKAKKALGS